MCTSCVRAEKVVREDGEFRFCFAHLKLEPVTSFTGSRSRCDVALEKLRNARRERKEKRKAEGEESLQETADDPREGPVGNQRELATNLTAKIKPSWSAVLEETGSDSLAGSRTGPSGASSGASSGSDTRGDVGHTGSPAGNLVDLLMRVHRNRALLAHLESENFVGMGPARGTRSVETEFKATPCMVQKLTKSCNRETSSHREPEFRDAESKVMTARELEAKRSSDGQYATCSEASLRRFVSRHPFLATPLDHHEVAVKTEGDLNSKLTDDFASFVSDMFDIEDGRTGLSTDYRGGERLDRESSVVHDDRCPNAMNYGVWITPGSVVLHWASSRKPSVRAITNLADSEATEVQSGWTCVTHDQARDRPSMEDVEARLAASPALRSMRETSVDNRPPLISRRGRVFEVGQGGEAFVIRELDPVFRKTVLETTRVASSASATACEIRIRQVPRW